MISTASDISPLATPLRLWEWTEYISEALVIAACVGELVANLGEKRLGEVRRRHLERCSIIVFVGALSISLLALIRTNELSGRVIELLGDKAGQADNKAKAAIRDSSLAVSQERDALDKIAKTQQEIRNTESDAKEAHAASSNAFTLAGEASTEASSFEKDIVAAKRQAADAESHLAEALKEAADATSELNRLKAPRSLIHVPELISALKPFNGTDYVFVSVTADEESVMLLRSINEALQKAGWMRGKSVAGFPALNVYGKDMPNFFVPSGLNTGVQVSAEFPTKLDFEKVRMADLPIYLQAAGVLNVALRDCISPFQASSVGKVAQVDVGTSTTVRIAVGRKP